VNQFIRQGGEPNLTEIDAFLANLRKSLIEQPEWALRRKEHTVPERTPEYGDMVIDHRYTGCTVTIFIGPGGFADMQKHDADNRDRIERKRAARELERLAERIRGN